MPSINRILYSLQSLRFANAVVNNIDKEQSNKAAISNSESVPSNTHEYSEEDIQKFEKLITKDQSSKD